MKKETKAQANTKTKNLEPKTDEEAYIRFVQKSLDISFEYIEECLYNANFAEFKIVCSFIKYAQDHKITHGFSFEEWQKIADLANRAVYYHMAHRGGQEGIEFVRLYKYFDFQDNYKNQLYHLYTYKPYDTIAANLKYIKSVLAILYLTSFPIPREILISNLKQPMQYKSAGISDTYQNNNDMWAVISEFLFNGEVSQAFQYWQANTIYCDEKIQDLSRWDTSLYPNISDFIHNECNLVNDASNVAFTPVDDVYQRYASQFNDIDAAYFDFVFERALKASYPKAKACFKMRPQGNRSILTKGYEGLILRSSAYSQ